MTTFLLIWDASDAGYPPDRRAADIAATAAGRPVTGRWSFGSRRTGTAPGDHVYLLRQRTDRGIVASGTLADGLIYPAGHWLGRPGRNTYYADVRWNCVLPVADRLPFDELLHDVPGHDWRHIYGGGQQIRPPAAEALHQRWADHLADLRFGTGPAGSSRTAGGGITMTEPEDQRPETTEEAAEIVRNDPGLQSATDTSKADSATDDDARTPDSAPTGESRT